MQSTRRSLIPVLLAVCLFASSTTFMLAEASDGKKPALNEPVDTHNFQPVISNCPASALYRLMLPIIVVSGATSGVAVIDRSGGWRVPFDGTKSISDGPGEEYHTNASAEAIDYASAGSSFPVLAPADGTVLDVLQDTQSTFGWVIRINHNNTYSFFAHLDPSRIFVKAGDSIIQGQCIAMSSNSGLPQEGIHLHYEARINAIAGNIFSGQSIPIRAIPGNWWNPWYSPVPNQTHDSRFSGGAQYPENRTQPSTMLDPNGRHLANQQSPTGAIDGYTSNVTGYVPNGQVTIHMAASPNTPNSTYATTFSIYKWQGDVYGDWIGLSSISNPTFADTLTTSNQSYANGQHTYVIEACPASGTCTTADRYIEVWVGDSTQPDFHLAASYSSASASDVTTLEFCSGAVLYEVYENHGGATTLTYRGPDCSIMVHRYIGMTNAYYFRAQYWVGWADPGWSPYSNTLYLHY